MDTQTLEIKWNDPHPLIASATKPAWQTTEYWSGVGYGVAILINQSGYLAHPLSPEEIAIGAGIVATFCMTRSPRKAFAFWLASKFKTEPVDASKLNQ